MNELPPGTPMRGAPASLLESSFRFHASLERPGDFLRREWRAIALATGAYVALMLAILFAVDAPFFYPRIETDQLNYLLKAKSLVETGSTAVRLTVNQDPFPYAAMPGVLRAPFLLIFEEFDHRLRAIQLMNVAIVAATAIMCAYVLSWVLAPRFHKWAIAFSFAFLLLSPDWLTNTFVPLADAPYAALTIGCLILAALTLTSSKPLASHSLAIAAFIVLFVVAFFIRTTAPVILLAAAMLAWKRWDVHGLPRPLLVAGAVITIALVGVLVALNSTAIFGRYLTEAVTMATHEKKLGMAITLFGSALPAQVVPVFNLGFQIDPVRRYIDEAWAGPNRDIVWNIVGFIISAVIIRGMFIMRTRLAPELAALLAALPVLTVFPFSTTRYLMSYQPFIWICFFAALAAVAEKRVRRATGAQLRLVVLAGAVAAMAAIVFVRSARTAQTVRGASPGASFASFRGYTNDVAVTFRNLRTFVESLPRDRTLLIGGRGNVGRFTVISDRNYYRPDSNLTKATREKDVYMLLSCGTAAACTHFDEWLAMQARTLARFGNFRYEDVYDFRTANARALVQRVRPLDAPAAGDSSGYSASGRTAR